MGVQIGIVGKPNVGKSTFFNAATEAHAEIANYPFTTIDANRGVMYVRSPCPCKDFGLQCNPNNSRCHDGVRFVPIEAIDVAGLVPKAHEGRGLGNKFLDDLRQAHALIHVVDASGCADAEGNPCKTGSHNPLDDVLFLEEEITFWLDGIIKRSWERVARQCEVEGSKIEKKLAERLTGLGVRDEHINSAIKTVGLESSQPSQWSDDDLLKLSDYIRKISKPMLIAFNKCDIAPDNLMQKKDVLENKGYIVVPTGAEAELALRKASEAGFIRYNPGDNDFEVLKKDVLSTKQLDGLKYIQTHVLHKYGSTGVQECIEKMAFEMLNLIVVYPVEDETHLTDKEGRILPDAFLVPCGSTAKDLAYIVHTDLGDHFIRAIDARTHRVVGADYELKDKDVIRIVSDA